MSLVVKNKIKELAKEKDSRCSGELYEALDKKVEKLILKAHERAKANKRKTIMACDL